MVYATFGFENTDVVKSPSPLSLAVHDEDKEGKQMWIQSTEDLVGYAVRR